MSKSHSYIAFIFILLFSNEVFPQVNCTVPAAPVLTSVSVQPETGKIDFKWDPSPSENIAAYIIYSYKDGDGFPIDTIWNPLATTFTLTTTSTKYLSVSYVVTAHRLSAVPGLPGCTSPLSNALSTIYCDAETDTCNKRISVAWNKALFRSPVREYRILVSQNGNMLEEFYTADKNSGIFTISNFVTNVTYCIAVRAILEDGTISNSNKDCVSTKMQRPPDWINATSATVNDQNNISLSFSIDPFSEIGRFILEKKTGSSGIFQIIAKPEVINDMVTFIDEKADITVVNYYRLSAINSCNTPVTMSNISSNIVLSVDVHGDALLLAWNPYKEWLGAVASYELFINTGQGFESQGIMVNDTVYSLKLKNIIYDISGSDLCFYISASEKNNPHSLNGQSNSSIECTRAAEIITVPNVFTPNNDLNNDLFKPVLSFTPRMYHLVISDRKGKILFETRDAGASWDGSTNATDQSGSVLLWFLTVTTPSGKSITKTGTLTVIR